MAAKTTSEARKNINKIKDDIAYDQYVLGQIETKKGINSPEYKAKANKIKEFENEKNKK